MDELNISNRKRIEKEYKEFLSENKEVLKEIVKSISSLLEKTQMHVTIKSRLKSFESYYQKFIFKLQNNEKVEITDLLGIRIICPFLEEVKEIELLIKDNYDFLEEEHKGELESFKEFGYKSTHFLINVPKDLLYIENQKFYCEIQVRTILQDAWAEVEHELIYKSEDSPFNYPIKRKLAALNANLTLSDIIFQEIRDHHKHLNIAIQNRRNSFFDKIESTANDLIFENIDKKDLDVIKVEEMKMLNRETININLEDQDIDNLLLQALNAHNIKEFKNAIDIYTIILSIKPVNFVKTIVLLHRGMAYFSISKYHKAIIDFSKALEIDNKNYKGYYNRGMSYRVIENYEDSLDDFNKCIELHPFNYEPFYGRAQVFYHLGDFAKALSDSHKAFNIKPDNNKIQKFINLIKLQIEKNK